MPIDFAAIAAEFAPRYRGQLRFISELFIQVGKALTARLRQAERLEIGSRRFPVVVFENNALMVAIHPSQYRTLVPRSARGFGETMVEAGRRFLGGFERIGEATREDRLLPQLIGQIEGFLAAIRRSVERFRLRRPEEMSNLFDPRRLSGIDILGIAALAYQALATSTGELRALAPDLRESVRLFGQAFAAPAGSVATASPGVSAPAESGSTIGRSLPEDFDLGARIILGTILLLPALPSWFGLLASAAWIRVRLMVIDALAGIERTLFDFRRRVIDAFFVDLPIFMGQALFLVQFLGASIAAAIEYWSWFGQIWLGDMLAELIRFGHELTRFMNFWSNLINAVVGFFERLLNFDLMPFLVAPLGLPAWVLSAVGALPRLTLNDILDTAGTAVRITTYGTLTGFVDSIRTLLMTNPAGSIIYYGGVKRKLDLIQQLLDALFQTPRPYPEEIRPLPTPTTFPNFFEAFFGPGTPDIASALQRFATGTVTQIQATVQAGVDMLAGFARTFSATANAAARMGSPERYRALAARADRLAEISFGSQLDELSQRVTARSALPMEEALVNWLTRGGFHVIGAVIPAYVAEMRRFWRRQVAEGNELMLTLTATSPHILARRARLGRVRMRRLLITAHGRQADEVLVAEIAQQFKQAVEQAYVTGFAFIQQARQS